jgi:transcriptional regulator with XRE-family HTH domain
MARKPEEITGRELIRRQLKRLREAAGLSMQQFATECNYSKGRIADMESGRHLPTMEFAEVLDERYKPTLTFVELLSNVRDALIAEHMRDLVPHERAAVRIQTFSSSVIPGLLQTPAYAWELSREYMLGASDEEVSEQVALRIDRQQIFERSDPPFYRAVIHESALISPSRAMVEQLRKLESIAAKPRSRVHIYPAARGLHAMMGGSLNLWHLADGRTVALVESFGPGEAIESPARVTFYGELFDEVRHKALSSDDSLDVIRRYIEEYKND